MSKSLYFRRFSGVFYGTAVENFLYVRDGLVARHQGFHNGPRDEIAHRANDEHDEVGVLRIVLVSIGQAAGELLDEHAAEAARHGPDAGDRADGALGKHIGNGGEQIGRPGLMRGGPDANGGDGQHGGPGVAKMLHIAEVLRAQHGQRHQGDEKHGQHARLIDGYAFFDDRKGNAAAINAAHNGDAINNKRRQHDLVFIHAKLFFKVVGQPEKIKPPNTVGQKFPPEKRPGLAISQHANTGVIAEFSRAGSAFEKTEDNQRDQAADAGQEVEENRSEERR